MTDVKLEHLTRDLISLENRTPLEVFDIMCDRIRHAWNTRTAAQPEREAVLEEAAKICEGFEPRIAETPDEFLAACEALVDAAAAIRALKTTPAPAVSTEALKPLGDSE